MPHLNDEPCPPCKIIIDGGFVRAAATLLASTAGPDSDLGRSATFLADMTASNSAALLHGIEEGVIPETAVDWDGCHRATEIVAWVEALEGPKTTDAELAAIASAPTKMREWAMDEFHRVTALIAGKKVKE